MIKTGDQFVSVSIPIDNTGVIEPFAPLLWFGSDSLDTEPTNQPDRHLSCGTRRATSQ